MKNVIIGISCLIILILSISLFTYEESLTLYTPTQDIEESTDEISKDGTKFEELRPIIVSDSIGYSLQNNELNVTYDNGENWTSVPIFVDALFTGEYRGNKQELIENSYILTEARTTFLLAEDSIKIVTSLDQGKSWKKSVVTETFPPLRYRKVDFLTDHFGYVILSGDRTMSQEWSTVFVTNDGGQSWREASQSGTTRLLYDGGFVDERTGFLSYGIINPETPDLYVTLDGGSSWTKANIVIPEKYNKIFVTAEIPYKEDGSLAMHLNQGPNGDYKGGNVKGKFVSRDNGLTWEFVMEVPPNATE
ncbi:WD40/YVTN/BNR-like repeat-containing protein [Ferdinandcohnia sp. Marseille-Q9671]